MPMRGNEGTLRNVMHIPYGALQVLLLLLIIGFGSTIFGKRFRYYSYGTIVSLLVFGVLTALQGAKLADNQLTPWLGIEERISINAAMLWIAVLSIGMLRAQGAGATTQQVEPTMIAPAEP